MRRLLVALCLVTRAPWSAPAFGQARNQLGPLCTTVTTPADQMVDARTRIIALKVFRGKTSGVRPREQEGRLRQVRRRRHGSDRLQPARRSTACGWAYYDKGEYEVAITDFGHALKLGPPNGIIFQIAAGNAGRGKRDYAKAIAVNQGRPEVGVLVRAEVVSITKNKQVPSSNSSSAGRGRPGGEVTTRYRPTQLSSPGLDRAIQYCRDSERYGEAAAY